MRHTLFSLLLAAGGVYGQSSSNTYTVIPKSDLSSTGELRFRDKQASPHYVGFKAPASIGGNQVWILPDSDAVGPLCSDGGHTLSFGCGLMTVLTRIQDAAASQIEYKVTGSLVNSWYLGTTSDEDNPTLSQFALLYGGSATTLWRVRQDGSLFTRNLAPIVGTTSALGTTANRWNHTWTNYLTVTDPDGGSGGVNAKLSPRITDSIDLGSSSFRWGKLYLKDIDISGTCSGSACGGFSTASTHTWTASQTFNGADLLASGTSNIGSGAAPWTDTFSSALYGETVAIAKPGTTFGTSYKWHMNPGAGVNGLYLDDSGPTNILLYQAPTISTRTLYLKGHFIPIDTQTWDLGAEWPQAEWRNIYGYGLVQGSSFRVRTGNGTSTEVISAAQDVTAADVFVTRLGASRVSIYNGGPSAGGLIQTYDSTGGTVVTKINESGFSIPLSGGSTSIVGMNFGGQYGTSVAGKNYTIKFYDPTATGGPANDIYGIGIAPGVMEFTAGNTATFRWYNNSTTPTNTASLSSAGMFTSLAGFAVNGSTVVDSLRNISGTSLTINGTTTIDLSRNLYVNSCSGCLSSINSSLTFGADAVYDIASVSNRARDIYAMNLYLYRFPSDISMRVRVAAGGGTGTGNVTVTDSSGGNLSRLGPDGVRTDVGFVANGNTGVSGTFTPSACSSVTFTFGILTSKSGC